MGLLPAEGMSVADLERLWKARRKEWLAEKHFEAVQIRWLARFLVQVLPYSAAVGYRMAKATVPGTDRYERIPELKLQELLDAVPWFRPVKRVGGRSR